MSWMKLLRVSFRNFRKGGQMQGCTRSGGHGRCVVAP